MVIWIWKCILVVSVFTNPFLDSECYCSHECCDVRDPYVAALHDFQGIVLLLILVSGLCCMMGIDTPTRFEAPQEN
ncbi:hypothetical protein Goshw_013598 [Gossypium schwendimanii]|uniref:V-type proton ATPase subunit S1/VOA1 transmembrane domain-containing protein n=1 Tax=Gossypium schwendimanii TaxID=34291 RepID=A0A7J9L347_GOSSC|nr:hypothetical protein [Gossypium schwendimanii]